MKAHACSLALSPVEIKWLLLHGHGTGLNTYPSTLKTYSSKILSPLISSTWFALIVAVTLRTNAANLSSI